MPPFDIPSCRTRYCDSEMMEQIRKDVWLCPRCQREQRIPTHEFRVDEVDPRTEKKGDQIDNSNQARFVRPDKVDK